MWTQSVRIKKKNILVKIFKDWLPLKEVIEFAKNIERFEIEYCLHHNGLKYTLANYFYQKKVRTGVLYPLGCPQKNMTQFLKGFLAGVN